MKDELIEQYDHSWRVLATVAADFDREAWLHAGCGTTTPARIAFHILQAVKYYLEDPAPIHFSSGKSFEQNCGEAAEENLPSQRDIVECIDHLRSKTQQWLSGMEFEAENQSFKWAGPTQFGVALFLLRHTMYHLGELSALLTECKNGAVEDHYVKAL
jgi:hypothetical protein